MGKTNLAETEVQISLHAYSVSFELNFISLKKNYNFKPRTFFLSYFYLENAPLDVHNFLTEVLNMECGDFAFDRKHGANCHGKVHPFSYLGYN